MFQAIAIHWYNWRHWEAPREFQTSQANRASLKSLESLRCSEPLSYTTSRHIQAVYREAVYGEIQVGLCPHPVLPLKIIHLDLIFEPHRGAVGQ